MDTSGAERADRARTETTRRGALKLAGGAAILAISGAASVRATLAQEASPVASPVAGEGLVGKYVVVRVRTIKPDRSADELMAMIQDGFVPLLQEIPGFLWYVSGANPETGGQFSVGVFADEAGVAESNRIAAEWGALGAAEMVEGDPEIHEGAIGVAAEPRLPEEGLAGTYVVIRLRQPNPEWPVDEVLRLIGDGYVPLVEEIPGFISYFGSAESGADGQAYVGVFADKTGADESTRIARAWLTENGYDFFEGDPTVAEGVVGAASV